MTHPTSRRRFLRATAGLLGSGLLGCSFESRQEPGTAPRMVRRPLIRSFGDSVRIDAPVDARPVGYVSMATRRVFVDRGHRDRVSWLLDAHISVSTWVWRIPLPGDSPLTPISPGDTLREFEELPMGAWDPGAPPADGDTRIVVGRPFPTRYVLECAPVQGTTQRISAGDLDVVRCLPGPGDTLREDFSDLTVGRRHLDPECGDEGSVVQVFGWCQPR